MERILLAGDTHADLDWVRSALPRELRRSSPDVIVVAGDFGFWPGQTDRFLDELDALMDAHDLQTWFVDGNHENHDALAGLERDEQGRGIVRDRIRHLPRGHRWTFGHKTWLAVGGAVSVDRS